MTVPCALRCSPNSNYAPWVWAVTRYSRYGFRLSIEVLQQRVKHLTNSGWYRKLAPLSHYQAFREWYAVSRTIRGGNEAVAALVRLCGVQEFPILVVSMLHVRRIFRRPRRRSSAGCRRPFRSRRVPPCRSGNPTLSVTRVARRSATMPRVCSSIRDRPTA